MSSWGFSCLGQSLDWQFENKNKKHLITDQKERRSKK
jgi:hypothetical protein